MKNEKERKIISWLLVMVMVIMMAVPATAAAKPKISKTSAGLYVGQSLTLKVTGLKNVKWSTSNKKIATVNSKGKVVAKKAGTAYITATSGKKKLKCKVSVKAISLSSKKLTIRAGLGYSLSVSAKNLKKGVVTWKSSNPSVAKVTVKNNYRAMVFGLKAGTCTITAKVFGKSYPCKVTVTKKPVYATATTVSTPTPTPRPTNTPTPKPIKTPTPIPTPKATIEVNRSIVSMTKSATINVTLNSPASTVNFYIENPNVVAAEWSNIWSGNTTQLKLTGLRNGTTRILLTNDYNSEQAVITVNVSGFVTVVTPTPRPTATPTPKPTATPRPTATPTPSINIELPTIPAGGLTFSGYDYRDNLEYIFKITNISIEKKYYEFSDDYSVKLYVNGTKTYDVKGTGQSRDAALGWKLYRDGAVVKSGTLYSPSVVTGESFVDAWTYIGSDLRSGNYVLKIMSTNKEL